MVVQTQEEHGRAREFNFTQSDFDWIRNELYDYAGIVLADHKRDMAYNRLVRQLRRLQLNSFKEYFSYLDSNPEEFSEFINAMTTNLTAFYRERHHFDFVANTIVPGVEATGQKKLRIWSAACSMGEEPYSIAMTLADALPDISSWDIRILATDIDSKVLSSAASGVYGLNRVEKLDQKLIKRWFLKGKGKQSGNVRVRPFLQDYITFKNLNLMNAWPVKGPLDFIFCRNVMIYFDQETQKKLLDRFAEILKPDGYLLVGHSESPFRLTDRFKLVGKTIYQKVY